MADPYPKETLDEAEEERDGGEFVYDESLYKQYI
jgi:hypothetical protein